MMNAKLLIITNNRMLKEAMSEYCKFSDVSFSECSFMDVLHISKSKIRDGYILLTHPFRGAIEPLEQPFKTVILKEGRGVIDFDSLKVINSCITRFKKSMNERPTAVWLKQDLADFAKVDLIIVERWLRKVYYKL